MCFCFTDAFYSLVVTPAVSEGGVAMVTLSGPEGQLESEVEVRLRTIDGNATAGVDFAALSDVTLSVGDSVGIDIFDNSEFEGDKFFSVAADLVRVGQVGVSPCVATVTILENDTPPQGY